MTSKDYFSDMKALFSEWQVQRGVCEYFNGKNKTFVNIDHTKGFIKDGVVCPETWFSNSFRPLFLLKEAYDKENNDLNWSLTEYLLDQSKKASLMWRRVSRWVYGLENTSKSQIAPYENMQSQISLGNEYLKQISVVNIKKSRGKSQSNMNTVLAYASYDKMRLRAELEYCDPTIIICGYTGSALEIILDEDFRSSKNPNNFYQVTINSHDVLVLDYWHPANHYPDILNYYGLMCIYQQSLLKNIEK